MAYNLGMTNPFLGQNNPYIDQTINNTMGDMANAYNMIQKPQMEAAQVNSGSFGNANLSQMQQYQQSQQAKNMGNVAANMRMQDYNNQQNMYQWDKNFGLAADNQNFNQGMATDQFNKSVYDTSFNQNSQSLQDYMNLMAQQNGFNQQDITNSTNIQNTPMNYWQGFTNSVNGVGQGYGTTTGTQTNPSNPYVGALGGWALGSQIANPTTKAGG